MNEMVLIFSTAMLSSILTWGIAWLVFKTRLSSQMEELKREIGEEIEDRVRAGALKAGEELLPDFRKSVTEGFLEAMKSWPSAGVVSGAAKSMAKTGADILGAGVDNLLKPRPRRGL